MNEWLRCRIVENLYNDHGKRYYIDGKRVTRVEFTRLTVERPRWRVVIGNYGDLIRKEFYVPCHHTD